MVWRVVASRLALSVLTLVLVSLIIFLALEAMPGDVATRILGRFATEEQKALFREEMNLDLPLHQRYLSWMGGVVRGDFGHSLASDRDVGTVIAPKLKNTLMLATYAFILYVPMTLILAIVSATNRNGPADNAISILTLIGLSMPEFFLATLLLLLFAVKVAAFPTMSVLENVETLGDLLRVMTLPALTLAIVTSVYGIRMLRDNLIEVLDADYIKMARIRGLSTWQVAWRHAMPNALLPTLNVTALNLAYLIGGVVVVERVFAFPGIGSQLINAIQLLDIPVVEAIVLIVSLVYILANLIADVLGILLTPRLRTG
jgi:peptide/nickel transport system permease protein